MQGRYKNGELDHRAKPGKNLTLGIDAELQLLGERLLEGETVTLRLSPDIEKAANATVMENTNHEEEWF